MKLATRRRLSALGVLAPPLLWTLLFMFVPYAIMFTYSFYRKEFPIFIPDFQFGNYLQLIQDSQYYTVFFRTLKIAAAVAVAAVALAYPLAYFLVFKIRSPSLRAALYMAVIVPLWVSYLLRAYTWKTILGSEGVLNSFLVWSGILEGPTDLLLYNQFAVVLTLTYIFIPFVTLPVFTALEKIPRGYIEASMDLGGNGLQTFRRIILPLSIPGLVAGGIFTFALSFGDFVTPTLLGGPSSIMISNVVMGQFGAAFDWPFGSAIVVIVIGVILSAVILASLAERRSSAPVV